jgi:hypothetical protein
MNSYKNTKYFLRILTILIPVSGVFLVLKFKDWYSNVWILVVHCGLALSVLLYKLINAKIFYSDSDTLIIKKTEFKMLLLYYIIFLLFIIVVSINRI